MNLKRPKKYKLLLDEGLPLSTSYPNINRYYDLSHVALMKKLRGKADTEIYALAHRENRIPVVFNTKDYKPLVTEATISIISLSINLSNKEADRKIGKALRGLKGMEEKGCIISITKTGIVVKRII